ncbi:molybdenum cofactor biosysynthesis protein [Pseudarthrobacter sp. NamE2]|uniref:MOSC domain-containing protein n=1 Tax=Pseudarthrobacter sp. NamE2 TaxID=2576838 RepID=UPI0010FE5DC8|nr:MOSC domain-containing protein [Pseudarthrobacter sp. NamE2]TLM81274.1 molybdenum cofactor biosysynthesis protein [Pseudarthrobacter sp. NamE2]
MVEPAETPVVQPVETFRYGVEILHLLVSPAHAYFGRARDGAADVPTTDASQVEVVEGKGIVGDRFFGKAAHMDAAVSLFAVEALEAIAAELGAGPFDPLLTRRNVVLRGAQLAPLLGQDFVLESGGDAVRFHGGRHAQPCAWMNEMLAPGAHPAMRGRGGIRCRALSSGVLHRGPAVLVSPVPLDAERAGVPSLLRPSRLP